MGGESVDKCESYERQVALAEKVNIKHEGKDTSLHDYLLYLKKNGLERSGIRAEQRTKSVHNIGDDALGV